MLGDMNLGYSKLDSVITNLETASPLGDAVSKFWSIDQTTGKVTASFTAGLDLKGNSLENVSKNELRWIPAGVFPRTLSGAGMTKV